MRHVISILLGLLTISALCCAAEPAGQRQETAVTGDVAAEVGAPTELHLRIVRDGFQLTWAISPQDPGTVTGYEIVRADVFSGPYEPVGTVDKGVSTFVDRTAKPEVIYFYKVRALAGTRYSPFSREAAGEIPGKP